MKIDVEGIKSVLRRDGHVDFATQVDALNDDWHVLAGENANLRREAELLATARDEAKQRADEWEYRAGDWMVRCEDAEGEAEALQKQLAAALEELTKVRKASGLTVADGDCPACSASRQGRLDVAAVTPHVGCYYA